MSPDFFTDTRFNPLVFLFGNLVPHLAVTRIPTQHVRIETGDHHPTNADNGSQNILEGIGNTGHQQIKEEPPRRVKEKAKIEGNHDADKLELGFQTANEEASTNCVNGKDQCANGGDSGNGEYLE